MVSGGALQCACNLITDVVFEGQIEFEESCEEVIVTRFASALPISHRPCVDHRVVEIGIPICALGGWFGRLHVARGVAFARNGGHCASVKAELVLRSVVD